MTTEEKKEARRNKGRLTLKGYFVTGLLIWIPIIVTLWVLSFVINQLDGWIQLLPEEFQPRIMGRMVPGFGVITFILVLLGTGVFAANVFGQRILDFWDRLLSKIPIVKSIYTSVKKVSDTLFSDSGQSFKTPVWVNFPHQDAWTLAFVAGEVSAQVQSELNLEGQNEALVSVYVPTTPNPTSGYFIVVKLKDTRASAMSVDQALKYVISLGMVVPEEQIKKIEKEHQIALDFIEEHPDPEEEKSAN